MTVISSPICAGASRRGGSNHELHLTSGVRKCSIRIAPLPSALAASTTPRRPRRSTFRHVGEFVIPGTGRRVWWTGRVAIGLRHQPVRSMETTTQSSMWIQTLMLGGRRAAHAL
jgi:hypothetical protein